jgi:hypothetical protein
MPQKSKTPAGTGASRDSFAGLSLPLSTPFAIQAQFLIAAHHVRPELARARRLPEPQAVPSRVRSMAEEPPMTNTPETEQTLLTDAQKATVIACGAMLMHYGKAETIAGIHAALALQKARGAGEW